MKLLNYIIMGLLSSMSLLAGELSFIQVGREYEVTVVGVNPMQITVVAEAGGGWYQVVNARGARSYLNLAQALAISPRGGSAQQNSPAQNATPAGARADRGDVRSRILNNLRQLSAAADQYFLETGTMSVR